MSKAKEADATMSETTVTSAPRLPVGRMGFGAMQLTDTDVWGAPADLNAAVAVVRRAVELGVTFVDTADSYGLGANEELLAKALHPYPEDLLIATKAGLTRPGPVEWAPVGRPEYLRQQAELSLRRLRLECIDLFQLHRVDPDVPFPDQIGALKQLQEAGKIRHVGLSSVTIEQIATAREIVEIVSVQNRFNLLATEARDVLNYCEREALAFIPYEPIQNGLHATANGVLAAVADEVEATPVQVALAWLLHQSAVVLPIPGTASIVHLEENVAAEDVALSTEQLVRLSEFGQQGKG